MINSLTWNRRDWLILLALLFLACLASFPALGSYGIIDPSDGLYTEGAREMVESGDYLTPHLNYENYFEKPILIYWLIASSYRLFGVSEFAARLPIGICVVLCATILYVFSRSLIRQRAACLGVLALLGSSLFLIIGHVALIDVPLTLFISIASMSFLIYLRQARISYLVLAYISLGLALLLKGPVSLVLLGIDLFIYQGVRKLIMGEELHRGWWQYLLHLKPVLGLVVITIIAAPWYVLEGMQTGGEFTRVFFITQHLGRLAGALNHGQNPWWFYAPFLLGGLFPWSVVLLASGPMLLRNFKHKAKLSRQQDLSIFCLCWAATVIILFSLIKTKLGTYVLPAFPPLCLITGVTLDKWIRLPKAGWGKIAMPLLAVAIIVLAIVSLLYRNKHPNVDQTTISFILAAEVIMAATVFFCSWNLRRQQVRTAVWQLVGGTYLAVCLATPAILGVAYEVSHAGLQDLLQLARQAKANLVTYQRGFPAANFYMRERLPMLISFEDIERYRLTPKKPHYVLCSEDTVGRFKLLAKPKTLITYRNKLYLFSLE